MEPPPLPPARKPVAEPLVIGTNGHVCAIDPRTGGLLWSTELRIDTMLSKTRPNADTSVLVHDGVVYAGIMGNLFGLDLKTGRILWHNALQGKGYNEVALAMNGVATQFITRVVRSQS